MSGENQYGRLADRYAKRYGIPPTVFRALITQESGWNPAAGSPAGAYGLTQVVPKWHPKANLKTPQGQLDYGAKHLASLYKKYGNWNDALSVYNSGRPWAQGQKIGETAAYVPNVMAMAAKRGYGGGGLNAPLPAGGYSIGPAAQTAVAGAPPSLDMNRLWPLIMQGRQQALAGKRPTGTLRKIASIVNQGLGNAQSAYGTPVTGPTGPAPTAGGGWGGSEGAVKSVTALPEGFSATSEKRDKKMTASGGVSDHWAGNTSAFARDIGWGGSSPTPKADALASRIVASLGGPKNWGRKGGNFVVTRNGYRYQVIYRSNVGGNHFNHIHVGAKRVG